MDGILTVEGFDTSLAEGLMLMTPFAADAPMSAPTSLPPMSPRKYGLAPNQFAADGYDCVYAIYQALEAYASDNGGLTPGRHGVCRSVRDPDWRSSPTPASPWTV